MGGEGELGAPVWLLIDAQCGHSLRTCCVSITASRPVSAPLSNRDGVCLCPLCFWCREGLCTTLCKWNREALIGVDDIYAGLSDTACIKRCLKTAAVVNPGQCRFYACPATKLKYATAAQCQSACAVQCVALLGVVSDAGSTQDCSREVASFNPGKSG